MEDSKRKNNICIERVGQSCHTVVTRATKGRMTYREPIIMKPECEGE